MMLIAASWPSNRLAAVTKTSNSPAAAAGREWSRRECSWARSRTDFRRCAIAVRGVSGPPRHARESRPGGPARASTPAYSNGARAPIPLECRPRPRPPRFSGGNPRIPDLILAPRGPRSVASRASGSLPSTPPATSRSSSLPQQGRGPEGHHRDPQHRAQSGARRHPHVAVQERDGR